MSCDFQESCQVFKKIVVSMLQSQQCKSLNMASCSCKDVVIATVMSQRVNMLMADHTWSCCFSPWGTKWPFFSSGAVSNLLAFDSRRHKLNLSKTDFTDFTQHLINNWYQRPIHVTFIYFNFQLQSYKTIEKLQLGFTVFSSFGKILHLNNSL